MFFDRALITLAKPFGLLYVLIQYKTRFIIRFREITVLGYHVATKRNRIIVVYTKNHPRMNVVAQHAPEDLVFVKLTQRYKDNKLLKLLLSKVDAIYQDGPHPVSIETNHPRALEFEHRYFKQALVDDPKIKKIFVMSHYAKPDLVDPDHKIEVLYPAFPVIKHNKLRQKGDNSVMIFLSGSDATRKGVDILFSAFERVEASLSGEYQLSLVIASNYKAHSKFYPVTEACLERTRNAYLKSKSRSNVIFTPIYPPQLISYFYKKADIYVIPTRHDTPGMSILEAMSAGLPVITTGITSIPEFVAHGKNGFLIDVKDYDLRSDEYFEYAVAVMQNYLTILIKDAALRHNMGLNSIKRMETMFSLDYKIDRLASTFRSATMPNQNQ